MTSDASTMLMLRDVTENFLAISFWSKNLFIRAECFVKTKTVQLKRARVLGVAGSGATAPCRLGLQGSLQHSWDSLGAFVVMLVLELTASLPL